MGRIAILSAGLSACTPLLGRWEGDVTCPREDLDPEMSDIEFTMRLDLEPAEAEEYSAEWQLLLTYDYPYEGEVYDVREDYRGDGTVIGSAREPELELDLEYSTCRLYIDDEVKDGDDCGGEEAFAEASAEWDGANLITIEDDPCEMKLDRG